MGLPRFDIFAVALHSGDCWAVGNRHLFGWTRKDLGIPGYRLLSDGLGCFSCRAAYLFCLVGHICISMTAVTSLGSEEEWIVDM